MSDLYTVYMPVQAEQVNRPLTWRGQKAPGDVRQYCLDVTSWLYPGDSIATVSASVAPNGSGDIAASSPIAVSPGRAGVTLAHGNAGTVYAVTFTIVTTEEEELVRTVWLFCQNLSPEPPVAPTVQAVLPAVVEPLVYIISPSGAGIGLLSPWSPGVPQDPTGLPPNTLYNNGGAWAWTPPA
jgi:hypothetical protein